MHNTQSIHALVRLLKSPTDPPSSPGPFKIEIASHSWSDSSFRAANKAEVIGEWMLTLLGQAKKARREKDAHSTPDPITDPRYWTLLSSVLTTPPSTTARPIKTWLLPLLNRLQLDTIVIELLTVRPAQVLAPARASLGLLWPMAEKKVGVDALGECLGAVFDVCSDWDRVDDDLCWICAVVVGAYRNALGNAGNKKKLYSAFLTTHLLHWLCAIRPSPRIVDPSPTKQLQDSLYAAGIDTLFSLDVLKRPIDTLFDALASSAPLITSVLPVLPRIFTSYLNVVHRHRSTLFPSTSSSVYRKEEARTKGMDFVGRCWSQIWCAADLSEGFEVEKWKSVIGVFEIIQKERIFVVHTMRDTHKGTTDDRCKAEVALNSTRDKAVEVLESVDVSFADRQTELLLATQLLDVLIRIEYDFLGCVLERVLSALINIPPSSSFHSVNSPSSELLAHILEYHTKTRTVHKYALALFDAVVASSASWGFSSQSTMHTFPLAYHLPVLAHALRTALTPTQTSYLASVALHSLEKAWTSFKDANKEEEKAAKKRKTTEDTDKGGRRPRSALAQARAFSYMGRIVGVALSSLPPSAYIMDEDNSREQVWSDACNLGWSVVWECLGENTRGGGEDGIVKSEGSKKRKRVVESGPLPPFYRHVVASTALRFLYDVRSRLSSLLGESDRLGEAHIETLHGVVQDEASHPELVLEIIRTLLWQNWYTHYRGSQSQTKAHPIFTAVLDIITAHPLSKSTWSGISAALTRENLGLAVMYVLTDRWIDVFDALASTKDLERFITLLLTVSSDPSDEEMRDHADGVSPPQNHTMVTLRGIFFKLLRNAQFWELHHIRGVLLSSLLTLTAPLSSCFPATATEASATEVAEDELPLLCNVYRVLHFVPSEYFTRSARVELVKRAMAADILICAKLGHEIRRKNKTKGRGKSHAEESGGIVPAAEVKNWSHKLTFIRVFLQRMGRIMSLPGSTVTATSTFINHLLSPPMCITSPSKELAGVTLDLTQPLMLNLLRLPEPDAAISFSNVVSTLVAASPFSQPNSQETWTHIIVQSSTLELIQHLTSEFDQTSLSDVVKRALESLLGALESTLSPRVQKLAEKGVLEFDQFLSSERIHAWTRISSLKRWLGVNVTSIPLGLKLATTACREGPAIVDPETYSSILELLFEELWCMPNTSRHAHLDVLVSFYAIYHGDGDSDGSAMDIHVTRGTKKMAVDDFSYVLDVLAEGMGGGGLRASQRERLIHLGKAMLHNAPQGTLRIIQHFATRCFHLFTDQEGIHAGSSNLQMQSLEFIARHCSDRPAAVRPVDLGNIWSFLHKTLTGTPEHDATTAFPIFHHIVTIIGALVRLRRDLVVHTLPHLGLVLRQLMMLMRKIRPQLGAKQSRIVTDTFPSWLSAAEPLSVEEARALARLLTSLTAKTIPRTYAHGSMASEPQKAESIAKPFAKHASYVLVAYVDAFNDPLCILNAEMRRELEPGLFSLCEMVGEHSRDALMVSTLDSGGKTILKSLWREYEKQRYVGKG